MENEKMEKKGGNQTMLKICGFIVDKRNLFFLIFRLAVVYTSASAECHHIHSPYTVTPLGTKRRYTGTTVLRLTHL